jgi:ribokinase
MTGRVVVIGDVGVDVLVRPLGPAAPDSDVAARTALLGGGAGANVAAWLATLDVPVTFVGRVGDDEAGRGQLAALAAHGVALSCATDPGRPTGTVVALTEPDGRRTMYTDRGANLGLDVADLPRPLGRRGDHLHVSGYALLDEGPRAAARRALADARELGMTTSVDASSSAPLAAVGAARFLRWVAGVDLLRATLDEARVLLGDGSVDGGALPHGAVAARLDGASAARALAQRVAGGRGTAVVSDGARGAWAASPTGGVHVPAVPVEVVDGVGAGDALTAGFLAARRSGSDTVSALAAGVALAARAVGAVGARPPHRGAPPERAGSGEASGSSSG